MSFDFFNNSNLAFGAKLTKVFTVLDRLAEDAESNVDTIASFQTLFAEYLHKNYIVPKPTTPESPCRTNELFDLIQSKRIYLNELRYDPTSKEVIINGVFLNKDNNRLTIVSGSSDLKKGYIRFKESISNSLPNGKVVFSENEDDKEYITICQYRVDTQNKLNIIGSTSNLDITPYDVSQYKSMQRGKTLATNNAAYKSDDYQAVCVVGRSNRLMVYLNGRKIIGNTQDLKYNDRHTIVYLKPNDEITGIYNTIFRIDYIS